MTDRSSRPGPTGRAARARLGDGGILGQGMRFAASGGLVAVVYLAATLLLDQAVGLPFQVALAIGYSLALATHFSLQRSFVWDPDEGFELMMGAQLRRYLAISLTQYGVTAVATAVLPDLTGVSTPVVYVLVTGFVSVVNFVLFRSRVFHSRSRGT